MAQKEILKLRQQVVVLKNKLAKKKKKLKRHKYQSNAFEAIYKHSMDGILLLENGIFVACNDAVIKMLGYDNEQQIIHLKPFQFSPEFQPDGQRSSELSEKMIELAMDNGQQLYDCVITRANGENFWVNVVLTRLKLENNDVLHVAWRDISRQKQLEQQVIQERDLANQANLAKSEFLANMSHEIRTPMHGIISYVNMALEKPQRLNSEKTQVYFSNIKKSADRLLILLNDLLDLSKLESGKMELKYIKTTLKDITLDCIAEQSAQLEQLSKQLIWNNKSIAGAGFFDPVRIRQVIANLISNAIKYSPEKTNIELSISTIKPGMEMQKPIPSLLFSIRDYGQGVPENELELIFDKFTQSSTSINRKTIGGTGLGLPISRQIIELHHGKIWAENHPQGGLIVKFIIPLQAKQADTTKNSQLSI